MEERTTAPQGTFEQEFRRRLADIFGRAEAVGLTVTQLCKNSGTARATPDRWRKNAPLSITLVDRLDAEVTAAEKSVARKRRAEQAAEKH